MSRGQLDRWIKSHDDDPRAQTPKVQELLTGYRQFHHDFGMGFAQVVTADVNAKNDANTRRIRDVAEALIALREKIDSDPLFSSADAVKARRVLLAEYKKLHEELPRLAGRLDNARAIAANPIEWAEERLETYPQLVARPGLPPF